MLVCRISLLLRKNFMEENALKLHGRGQIFRDASTCADPGFAGLARRSA
jgi:hypothetical protein